MVGEWVEPIDAELEVIIGELIAEEEEEEQDMFEEFVTEEDKSFWEGNVINTRELGTSEESEEIIFWKENPTFTLNIQIIYRKFKFQFEHSKFQCTRIDDVVA